MFRCDVALGIRQMLIGIPNPRLKMYSKKHLTNSNEVSSCSSKLGCLLSDEESGQWKKEKKTSAVILCFVPPRIATWRARYQRRRLWSVLRTMDHGLIGDALSASAQLILRLSQTSSSFDKLLSMDSYTCPKYFPPYLVYYLPFKRTTTFT